MHGKKLSTTDQHWNRWAQVETRSFGWLVFIVFCQSLRSRCFESWKRPYRRWQIENDLPAFRVDSLHTIQLLRRCDDPWSAGCLPCIRPLEYFAVHRPNTPITVRSPLGWVPSGLRPSTTGLLSTCFKAVTSSENDSILAEQLRSWYDMESYGVYKQVDSRSRAAARALKIRKETTFNDDWRHEVGMWADEECALPSNYILVLVQLKSLERRLGKDPQLKESHSKTIRDDFEKRYIAPVDESECFGTNNALKRTAIDNVDKFP